MIADPRTREFCANGDTFNGWIDPDVHFLFSTMKNGSSISLRSASSLTARKPPGSSLARSMNSPRLLGFLLPTGQGWREKPGAGDAIAERCVVLRQEDEDRDMA